MMNAYSIPLPMKVKVLAHSHREAFHKVVDLCHPERRTFELEITYEQYQSLHCKCYEDSTECQVHSDGW